MGRIVLAVALILAWGPCGETAQGAGFGTPCTLAALPWQEKTQADDLSGGPSYAHFELAAHVALETAVPQLPRRPTLQRLTSLRLLAVLWQV